MSFGHLSCGLGGRKTTHPSITDPTESQGWGSSDSGEQISGPGDSGNGGGRAHRVQKLA